MVTAEKNKDERPWEHDCKNGKFTSITDVCTQCGKSRPAIKAPGTEPPEKFMKLPDNAIDSFRSGAILDLRVRLAIEILTHSPLLSGLETEPAPEIAAYALDIADALFALAEKRGLLESLDSLAAAERLMKHVKRQVEFQHAIQKETQRVQEQGIHVGKAVANAFCKPN